MKKFTAVFTKIAWFNGGKHESTVSREIEARTMKSAARKAAEMEAYGKARTWYILREVKEA